MLDQTFSAENFRHVFDLENRRGRDVAGMFFPNLDSLTNDIHNTAKDLRSLRSQKSLMSAAEYGAAYKNLKTTLLDLKVKKSEAIDAELEIVSANALKSNFKIGLKTGIGPNQKPVFMIDGSTEAFFIVKQLQRNLNRLYGVKQSNRIDLLSQLRDNLSSRYPFEVVRTDISEFYETIDRRKLVDQLDTDQLLSARSKKYIAQILNAYGELTGSLVGIPRGVGISAYLAELYLRPFDRTVRSFPGAVMYGRYVDDIVAVFARSPVGQSQGSYSVQIGNALSERGLTANPLKTQELDLSQQGPHSLSYLGYDFTIEGGKCDLAPSAAKILRYEKRMKASFSAYHSSKSQNCRRSYRELIARVKFLTGNTRLSNSKSSAVTGIYYNNSLASDISALTTLDKKLKAHIEAVKRPKLRVRLKSMGFTKGFVERRFHNLSARELAVIVEVWKHD